MIRRFGQTSAATIARVAKEYDIVTNAAGFAAGSDAHGYCDHFEALLPARPDDV